MIIALSLGVVTATATTSIAATTDPEQSRLQMIDFLQAKYPNIKHEEFINGAYIFSPDKFMQWEEAAEELPPYLDFIDASSLCWL